jgi:DNA-binding NarL/FixJ family response regulator
VLYLDIDPAVLADLLRTLNEQGEVLAIRAGQDARLLGSADEAAVRTLLTAHGLTPRQCDLVILNWQGHSRADIAAPCGISSATVKKYWAAIYARLGVENRPMLRAWVQAHLARASAAPLLEEVVGVGP